METITYTNITVSGFPFQKITSLSIRHMVNQHAVAFLVGELDPKSAQDCVKRTDESTIVEITTKAEGQPARLFCGCVSNLALSNETEYSRVELCLSSTSCKLDVKAKNKTYQNTSKTYGQILSANLGEIADLHIMVSDRAIGSLLMQYNETDWGFASRMASRLGAPIVTNITSVRPQIYIGMPPASRTRQVDATSFQSGSDSGAYQAASGSGQAMLQDFGEEKVHSYGYAYLGDMVSLNGRKSLVKGVCAELYDGIVVVSLSLLASAQGNGRSIQRVPAASLSYDSNRAPTVSDSYAGTQTTPTASVSSGGSTQTAPAAPASSSGNTAAAQGGGSSAGIAVPAEGNAQASGKMLKGRVQGISGDKVQVHLTDIDPDGFDAGGTWWFPYSTAYSSSDGSGWYCMPEQGDEVRVFFPSDNEADAFAASSVCVSPPGNPKDKSWKAPNGKQILMTEDGLYIICNEEKIFINLTLKEGIQIESDKAITVSSDAMVSISGSDVQVIAEKSIMIGTAGACLSLTEDAATLSASNVFIN